MDEQGSFREIYENSRKEGYKLGAKKYWSLQNLVGKDAKRSTST